MGSPIFLQILGPSAATPQMMGVLYCTVVQLAQSGDDRSGGAMCEEMCEEDVETAKSEFRLGNEVYSAHAVYIQQK